MKAIALLALLAVLLLVGCTSYKSASPSPSDAGAPAQQPTPAPSVQAPVPAASAPQLSDAEVQNIDNSVSQMDAALQDLNSSDLEDTGITADTFK